MQKLRQTTVFYYETSALGCRCVKYTEIVSLLYSTSCDAINVGDRFIIFTIKRHCRSVLLAIVFFVGHQVHRQHIINQKSKINIKNSNYLPR